MNVAQAIAAVSQSVGNVGKNSRGPQKQGGFAYRGIDDVMNALSGPLATHGVVIVPNVEEFEQTGAGRDGWLRTALKVRYDIYGPDGDSISATVAADGLDNADKGPGKAMSYAYKTMAAQVFCICTDANMDNEATGYEPEPASKPRKKTAAKKSKPAESGGPSRDEIVARADALMDQANALPEARMGEFMAFLSTENIEFVTTKVTPVQLSKIEAWLNTKDGEEPF